VTAASLLNAVVFLAIGILAFGVALLYIGRAMPGNLWKQALEEKSLGAALILAGIALGLGWIIAAAVH
jgi:putative membrane protein